MSKMVTCQFSLDQSPRNWLIILLLYYLSRPPCLIILLIFCRSSEDPNYKNVKNFATLQSPTSLKTSQKTSWFRKPKKSESQNVVTSNPTLNSTLNLNSNSVLNSNTNASQLGSLVASNAHDLSSKMC